MTWPDWIGLNVEWPAGPDGEMYTRWTHEGRGPVFVGLEQYEQDAEYAASWALGYAMHLSRGQYASPEHQAAAEVIIAEGGPIPEGQDHRVTVQTLAVGILDGAQEVVRRIRVAMESYGDELAVLASLRDESGVLWADEVLAGWCAEQGEHGAKVGERWRQSSREASERNLFGSSPGAVWRGYYWPRGGSDWPGGDGQARFPWLLAIADALWPDTRAGLVDRTKRAETWNAPVMLQPVARFVATMGTSDATWLPAELADNMVDPRGVLATAAAQAMCRKIPEFARLPAVAGHTVKVWEDTETGHSILATPTASKRTDIRIIGGWSALSAYMEADRTQVADTVRQMHNFSFEWCADLGDRGRATLLMDLMELEARGSDAALVTFALSQVFHPAFASLLRDRGDKDLTRDARGLVSVGESMPPATNPRTLAATSRLEVAALSWMREHLDDVNNNGAEVPWDALATSAELSTSKQASRRRKVLEATLGAWLEAGRWVHTGSRWRPAGAAWEQLRAAKRLRTQKQRKARGRTRRKGA